MADTARRVEYWYATVSDTPGEATKLLAALREENVNLIAFLGFPRGSGQSQLDLVPEDPAALTAAAERAGVSLSEAKQAFLVQGDDRVGAVHDVTQKFADAGVNITALMATGAEGGRYGMVVWVDPADYERAASALGA